jgi:ATP-binding cassette subfamily B protein
MLFSTHRLTSVVDMDEIIVISGGKAIERGTHNELSAKGGMYRQLWDDQSLKQHQAADDDDEEDDD